MQPLLATSLIATVVTTANGPCPKGVIDQLDGLYRWQVQQMEPHQDPASALASQRQRFTPSLFELLLQARQLTPTRDGRYLNWDVFSHTQAATFAAEVRGCSAEIGNSIQATVDVQAGLRPRPDGTPRRLLYELNRDSTGSWRINDITYLNEQVFQLRPVLQKLIQPAP